MAATIEQPKLLERGEKPLQTTEPDPSSGFALMVERLAANPSVDVVKLEQIIDLQERILRRIAEGKFWAAMSDAQAEMRTVAEDAWNPQTKSRYSSYEALDRALRPIYTKHRFALSFDTAETSQPEMVRVVCDVAQSGFCKRYHVDMPADGKGAKGGDVMTKTHATGSALSYGQRYLLKMIFNVATGEGDDDGNAAASQQAPVVRAPDGFEDWWIELESAADTGSVSLQEAWNSGGEPGKAFRRHAFNTNKPGWETLKRKAAQVRS